MGVGFGSGCASRAEARRESKDVSAIVAETAGVGAVVTLVVGAIPVGVDIDGTGASAAVEEVGEAERACA